MFFSIFLYLPDTLVQFKNLIPGWTTFVKLLKQVKKLAKSLSGPLVELSN